MESAGEASQDGSSGCSGSTNLPQSHHPIREHSAAASARLPRATGDRAPSVPLVSRVDVSSTECTAGAHWQTKGDAGATTDGDIFVSIPTRRVNVSCETVDIIFSPSITDPSASTPFASVVGGASLTDQPPPSLTAALPATTPHAVVCLVAKRSSSLLHLSADAFSIVAHFCDDRSLLAVGAVCKGLNHAVGRRLDASVWRGRCANLWRGKLHFSVVDASRAPSVPPQVAMRLARAVSLVCDRPAPASLIQGLAHSWRAAYFVSKFDAARDFMTDDELFDFHWSVKFSRPFGPDAAAAAEAAALLPPSQVFRRIGRRNVVRAAAFLPEVPCQLYDGGRRVQVDVYPAHVVQRDADTWGWKIANAFVTFTSAAVAQGPVSPMPSPVQHPANVDSAGTSLVHIVSI